ncbi:hypothetical protein SAMN05421780_101631 [Flexibacter flexilis DSM 6793]|uniref:Uncharacterized protein n=1 Tax=Flexibacter flexilis DSM 6793 TaxID=927664 RepID=A0A1I1E4L8_9BACT|nr:hypothetical protein [Flexibacter flexilis]SFB82175.1 hypothetical protein SAMN05421780_101631 [Flexibacter flexilis DSM 6793]
MLNYVKLILQKVSFDRHLFEKELRKAIARLLPQDIEDLKHWCYEQYSGHYQLVLDKCFYQMG